MPNKRTCLFHGCNNPAGQNGMRSTSASSGYCALHANAARKCVIDGCENTVAAHNRSGCCSKEHRLVGRKLRPIGD